MKGKRQTHDTRKAKWKANKAHKTMEKSKERQTPDTSQGERQMKGKWHTQAKRKGK